MKNCIRELKGRVTREKDAIFFFFLSAHRLGEIIQVDGVERQQVTATETPYRCHIDGILFDVGERFARTKPKLQN